MSAADLLHKIVDRLPSINDPGADAELHALVDAELGEHEPEPVPVVEPEPPAPPAGRKSAAPKP